MSDSLGIPSSVQNKEPDYFLARRKRRKSSEENSVTTFFSQEKKRITSPEDKQCHSLRRKKISSSSISLSSSAQKTHTLTTSQSVSPFSPGNSSPFHKTSPLNLPFNGHPFSSVQIQDPLNPEHSSIILQSTPEKQASHDFSNPLFDLSRVRSPDSLSPFYSPAPSRASPADDLESLFSDFQNITYEKDDFSSHREGRTNPSSVFKNTEHLSPSMDSSPIVTKFLENGPALKAPKAKRLSASSPSQLSKPNEKTTTTKSCPESPKRKEESKNINRETIIALQSSSAELDDLINRARILAVNSNP